MSSVPPPPPPAAPQWSPVSSTPVGPAPGTTYAGFWIRFVANIIDVVVTGIPVVILCVALGAFQSGTCVQTATSISCSSGLSPTGTLISFAVPFAYFVVMWSMGGTLGMKALSIHVVDAANGQNISLGKAFVRYIGFFIASVPFLLGLMWAGWDVRKQGWHDKIGGTLVIRKAA